MPRRGRRAPCGWGSTSSSAPEHATQSACFNREGLARARHWRRGRPAHALYQTANDGPSACSQCLAEAYALLTQSPELAARRKFAGSSAADKSVAALLDQHFAGPAGADVVTTSRAFSGYLRADLQCALDGLLQGERVRSVPAALGDDRALLETALG